MLRYGVRLGLLAVLLAAPSAGIAQPTGLGGRWEGSLRAGGSSIPLVLHVEDAPEGDRALLDSPSQGAFGLAADVALHGDTVTIAVPSIGGTYVARVSEGRLDGTWHQGGAALPLVFDLSVEVSPSAAVQDPSGLAGDWGGKLDVGVMEVTLVLHLTFDGMDYSAALDSPDQSAYGIPADATVTGDSLSVVVPSVGAAMRGRLRDGALEVRFTQGGLDTPLRLTQEGAVVQRNRPQDPRAPFPYVVEAVTFESQPGIVLQATVTIPEGDGPHPAAVLVTGSGPQDRDESIMGHRPFAVLADYLTRRGIIVLRYDERGVGESTGNFAAATTVDFATDAAAAVRSLAQRPDVSVVGIVGHSEGGIVAPMVAGMMDEVAYVVLLAGTAVPGYEIIAHQGARIARSEGLSERAAASEERQIAAALARVVAMPLDEPIPDSVRAAVLATFRSVYSARSPEDRTETGSSDSTAADTELRAAVDGLDSPWLRYFLAYDPAPALRSLDVPVLALLGEMDLQVTPEQNESPMRDALAASASPDWTVETVARANHLFQTAQTGAIREYATIEETMSPAVLDRVAIWIFSVSR